MATTTTAMLSFVTFLCLVTFTFTQENPSLTFTMEEEKESGFKVGSLATAQLGANQTQIDNMVYSFLSDDNQQFFSLQDTTGNLFTMVVIDRESVCKFRTICEISFNVLATASGFGFVKTITVKIIIEDINDNPPLFPVETQTLEISEGVTLKSSYPISNAIDTDTGENNGIQSYEISPPSDMFGLQTETNSLGIIELQIYVNGTLDREVEDLYKITVIAKDGGDPQLIGAMNVDIVIMDLNDEKPKFDQDIYNKTIEEDTSPGTVILSVHALDKDSGNNGLVTYKISQNQANAEEIHKDFSVDSTSGNISVNRNLVYQADNYYMFIVEAVDNGEPAQVSVAKVFIYVNDAGNNPPTFKFSFITSGSVGFVNVSENAKTGDFVAHVNVDDTDSGPNGVVTCSVANSYFSARDIGNNNFMIVVNNGLNREVLDLHNVTVTCTDNGSPALSSSDSFLVRVTDYNDNKPVFEVLNYMASVYENKMEEQIILQVSATDNDIGKNKDIHYVIRNEDRIVVNAKSGVISVKPFFDRETEPVIIFNIYAIDGGESPLTGTATVTLTIKDTNDNEPTFLQPPYEFEIDENLNSGTSIGRFHAKDEDTGENGKFTFSLSPNYADKSFPFIIFPDGVIQSNRALDREVKSTYDFEVIVTDQGEPKLSRATFVTVVVKDSNDNRPNITFPRKDNDTVSMFYPENPVNLVTKIRAYDLDKGENRTLTYTINKGNDLGLVTMETDTGKIYIADKTIAIDEDVKLVLVVEVRDNGAEPLSSTAELTIQVIYTNATVTPGNEEDQKYVIISVVVVIVTVLISAVIIGVIFLLRSLDRKKQASESQSHNDSDCGFTSKPSLFIINNSGESSTDPYIQTGQMDCLKKKKEVSFSFDDQDSMSNFQQQQLKVVNIPDPINYPPEKPPRREKPADKTSHDMYDKVTTQLETLKLQQMLMQTRAKQQQQQLQQSQQQQHNPDDSRSETSAETIPSDSGRGASEEEGPSTSSPSHDNPKIFDFSHIPTKYSTSNNLPVLTARTDKYNTISPPPIPTRSYKPYSSFNTNQNYPNTRQHPQYYSELSHPSRDSSVLDNSTVSWQHQPHSQFPYSKYSNTNNNNIAQKDYSDLSSLPSQYRGSVRSCDDDNCSTTTSGSYELYSVEDLL